MRTSAWLIASLVGLGVFAGSIAAQGTPAKPAAVVNGNVITVAELEAVLKSAPPTAVPLTEAQKKQINRDILEMMINDMLFQQFVRRVGPRIDVAEVDKLVYELVDGLRKQGKTLQEFLKENGQNEAQLRSSIVTKLQWDAYVKEHFTEAEIKRYYDENRDFFDRVTVRASHILIRLSPTASEAEQKDVRARLVALRQDILARKIEFAEAAKKYSQDTLAANGGDMGYFPRKMVVDELYARTAYSLKVGEVSPLLQTEFGLYLIKVTDRKPGIPSDFSQVKEAVKELCVQEAQMNLIGQLRKTAQVDINLP